MHPDSEYLQNKNKNVTDETAVILVTYNDMKYIEECLESVFENNPGEVIVVDNGSTDGTIDTVKEKFPEADLIQIDNNPGPGTANNHGVQQVDSEYVVILNVDTLVDENLIQELVEPLTENPHQITVPKILTYDGNIINTVGNTAHFSGLAFTRGYGDPPSAHSDTEKLSAISGACFATTRETYEELSGFEDSMFIYMDDTELSWKSSALGVDISYIPTAIVYHDYQGVQLNPEKLYHLESGRYIILRKYLTLKSFALILPSLFVTEVLTCGYAVSQGLAGVQAKLRAVFDGFSADVEPVEDDSQALLSQLDRQIPADQIHSSRFVKTGIQIANKLFKLNHSVLKQ